ncbi:MAG: gliding motility-associated C-terminal domain-containing protein [Bacteroidota bacterium]
MTVNPNIPVSILIGSSANPVCSGTAVIYTATPANGGSTPAYQWKVNGIAFGINSSTYTYTPANNDVVSCILTSSISSCAIGNPATSDSITMIVNPTMPVSVLIGSSANPVCTGTAVAYTATPTNGGTTPSYQWKVNGTDVGANSSSYSDIPSNYDVITCVLTSSISLCATGTPAISNILAMTVNPNLPVSVSIGSSANPVCSGTTVIYTATPTNGGTTPAYQWKVNGTNTGINSPGYSYNPANNDIISCALTSSISSCAIGNPATSNSVSMVVNPNLPVSILVVSSANPVCAGTTAIYSASPANGGNSPAYQWKVNGTNVGTNTSGYSYIPVNNDLITCVLTSSISACATGNPSASNSVKMLVNAIPVPVIAGPTKICNHSLGEVYTTQAGMTVYSWSVSSGGVITTGAGTGSITVDWNVAGNQTVHVSYTNTNDCNSLVSNFVTLVDVCPADLRVVKTANNMHPLFGNNIDFVVTATNDGPYNATKAVIEDILQSGYTYISSSATRGAYDPASGIWLLGNLTNGSSGSLTVTVKVNPDGSYINTSAISGFEADENMGNNISSIEPIPTDLFIPEGFSPNDDGINDILVIRGISNFPNNTFVVYNRWGNKVFEASPYNDTWDGISTVGIVAGGDKLPAGTYFYLFTPGDGSAVMKGSFYLNK